ncbi:hypothetical protein [uncultured Draconibacterium sp.]|uniref:hypothetical protein n=1 Tax=uncultured Draconibacterium sp. TaxID=1573823 RepID=UPI0029C8AE45|nr:hypothetical protein [uncultured Draconibacterium sp.]
MPNKDFHYRLIKARVAETLIKELFQNCGYTVFEYGMERTVPTILGKIQDKDEETAKQIRSMPDFVVQCPENGQLNYVEVKYRKSGKFRLSDLIKDYPYKNAIFIIVSKSTIRVISYNELEQGNSLPANGCSLEDCETFNLNKELVEKYKTYSASFFDGVE